MNLRPLALALLPAVIACASCREKPVPPPPAPIDSGTGGSPAADASTDVASDVGDACERACQHLALLGCAEAEPTPGGASCVEVCRNVEESGVVSLDLECVAQVVRCEDLDGCAR